jgi:molecular chaperone GrpE
LVFGSIIEDKGALKSVSDMDDKTTNKLQEERMENANIEDESLVGADEIKPEKKEDCKEKDKEIKNWKEEYNELYDKYLRLYSDFENFRKRTNREKIELIEVANEVLIFELLSVLDDFDRAIQSNAESTDLRSIREGVVLINNKLKKILEDRGVKEIDCIEHQFDPDLHEAITKIPAPKRKLKGKIIDQVQKGYYLKGKVVRHSKVVVGE